MFGFAGGRLFERGRLFEEIRYSPIQLGYIRSRDAFRPIARDQQLTNREALTVLFSVVKHAGSGQSTKEVQGEMRDYISQFFPLLECSSHLLSALQQYRAQSRLLYLFYNKESVKFPRHYFQFFKQTLFPKRTTLSSACSTLS